MRRKIIFFMILNVTLWAQVSWAGWLEDVVSGAAQRAVETVINRGAEETSDAAYNKAKDGIKDENDRDSGNVSSDSRGESGGGRETSSGSAPADEKAYSKYDFIPGDKVILFDDFSDTDVGEFPRKWTLNGPGGGGNSIEVVEHQGKRFLRSTPAGKDQHQDSATIFIRLKEKGGLPEKFTVEFDAVFANASGYAGYPNSYALFLLKEDDGWPGTGPALGSIALSGDGGASMHSKTRLSLIDGKVHHIAVSVNGTIVKAYIDQQRVVNDPDAIERPIRYVGIAMSTIGASSDNLMFTNFRLAEGGKDIKSALASEGRIVTHGILFDTGKATIKPESLPTLKMILGLLNDDPGLKFSIEGHTDNQGSKGINQPLSEERAAAVKLWLVDKGVVAARLTTAGFGDTRPISSNDTAEGRADNRRVEFVRM